MRNAFRVAMLASAIGIASTVPTVAEQVRFKQVLSFLPKSETDRTLTIKDVDLVFDHEARRLAVTSKDRPLNVPYGQIEKVLIEPSIEFSGGIFDTLMGVPTGLGERPHSNAWCYLEYRTMTGGRAQYLLEIDKAEAAGAIAQMRSAFGEALAFPVFRENVAARPFDKDGLADIDSEHDMATDKKSHPVPEVREDKALIVVVEPKPRGGGQSKGRQIKLHAGDRVEAVNKFGTYGFFYLDPGDYQLVSQSGNAHGLDITVEAAQAYYFLQYASMGGFRTSTALLRHSRELVLYLLDSAFHSVWSQK